MSARSSDVRLQGAGSTGRATQALKRAAFDAWYSKEHLPDAAKSFGAQKAWRFWSASDPSAHQAMYQFFDRAALDLGFTRDRQS